MSNIPDIAREYPNVQKVIFDDAINGYVYNYDNHGNEQNAEKWELVGTTLGYAQEGEQDADSFTRDGARF